ncbi:MAG TPA: serine/threonine-protein kinase [Blastocatellia bacterium]|nr:serine/threonine-protein kinase [Blastocatellia bacterium]
MTTDHLSVASLVGQTLGAYKVLKRLGAGGMGEVYKGQDTRLDRLAALKILPLEVAHDQERLQRFVREAKAASALNHPHVAKINRQPLPLQEVIAIGSQIADALNEAHSKGIIHRGIKPANVMLTTRGQVKVLDFGLAKITRLRNADFGMRNEEAETWVQSLSGTQQLALSIEQSGLRCDSLGCPLQKPASVPQPPAHVRNQARK